MARWPIARYDLFVMDPLDVALLVASVAFALAARAGMKRVVARRLGKASDFLLEVDFWKASSGETLTRALLAVELLAWLATVLLVAMLATQALQ